MLSFTSASDLYSLYPALTQIKNKKKIKNKKVKDSYIPTCVNFTQVNKSIVF
jgi:hypothetical protein